MNPTLRAIHQNAMPRGTDVEPYGVAQSSTGATLDAGHRDPWTLRAAMIAVAVTIALSLIATQSYFGGLLRGADAQMYYAQLRSMVIDGDLDCTNEIMHLTPTPQVFRDDAGRLRVMVTPTGRVANKYTVGWALLNAPAFSVTHTVATQLGWPNNGYGEPYQFAVAAWQTLLVLGSLVLLARALRRIASPHAVAAALVGVALATNFVYYAGVYPMMTHAASFACVATLLAAAIHLSLAKTQALRWWCVAAFALGMAVLVRPTDLVLGAVLLPAMFRAFRINQWVRPGGHWLVALAPPVAVAIQLAAWRLIHGQWIVNTYGEGGETFLWLNPPIRPFLFGAAHGGWYFHPAFALALAALVFAALRSTGPVHRLLAAALLAALLHLYVHGAWHEPTYGHSFGQRVLLNAAPILLVGLAVALTRLPRLGRWAVVATLAAMIAWNALLTVTYARHGISHGGAVPPAELVAAQQETMHLAIERVR